MGAHRLLLASLEPWSKERLTAAQGWSDQELLVEVIHGPQLVS